MNYALICLGLYGVFFLRFSISLLKNYLRARRIGLPIVVNPFDQLTVPWLIFSPMLQKTAAKWLPASIYRLIQSGINGHDFIEGWSQYRHLGSSTYIYVTSHYIDIICANPEFLEQAWTWKSGFELDHMAVSGYSSVLWYSILVLMPPRTSLSSRPQSFHCMPPSNPLRASWL